MLTSYIRFTETKAVETTYNSDVSEINSPSYVYDSDYGGYVFQGNGSGYLKSIVKQNYNTSDPITLEAWVKISSYDTEYGLIEQGTNRRSQQVLGIVIYNKSIDFEICSADHYETPALDTWHHLAIVYDGTTRYDFVDGNLVNTVANTTAPGNCLWIGTETGPRNTCSDVVKIAEIKQYNTAKYTESFTPPAFNPFNPSASIVTVGKGLVYATEIDTGKSVIDQTILSDTLRSLYISNDILNDTDRLLVYPQGSLSDTQREVILSQSINNDTLRKILNTINVSVLSDTLRIVKINADVIINSDTNRNVVYSGSIKADTFRKAIRTDNVLADTDRIANRSARVSFDTKRVVNIEKDITLNADTDRLVVLNASVAGDTDRNVVYALSLLSDTQRLKLYHYNYKYSTRRRIPFVFDFTDKTSISKTGTISIEIDLNNQSLSDTFAMSTVNDSLDVTDSITGKIFDFDFSFCVERLQYNEMTRQISGMYDCEKILYQYFTYQTKVSILHPEVRVATKWGTTIVARQAYYTQEYVKLYALNHADNLANGLGKNLIYRLEHNFLYSNAFAGSNQTYANIISGVFGWLSQIPTKLVNVYIRGNDLLIVQRGMEQFTVDLTNTKHTRPTYIREIVRTTITKSEQEVSDTTYGVEYTDGWTEEQWENLPDETYESGDYGAQYSNGMLVAQWSPNKTIEFEYENDDAGGCHPYKMKTTQGDETVTETMAYDTTEGIYRCVGKTTDYGDDSDYSYSAIASSGTGYTSIADDDNDKGGFSFGTAAQANSPYTRIQECRQRKIQDWGYKEEASVTSTTTTKTIETYDFPIGVVTFSGDSEAEYKAQLAAEIFSLDRSIKETVSMDIYEYDHAVDFNDKVIFEGNEYFLESNTLYQDTAVKRQSIKLVRWIKQ